MLLWLDTSARIVSHTMEDDEGNLFKVPFSNGIACCVMFNGNLLVYNVKEKTCVEVISYTMFFSLPGADPVATVENCDDNSSVSVVHGYTTIVMAFAAFVIIYKERI